ncbi:PD-(D/E)XK nuclease family protein [Halobacterium salinarum]|uniref:PD-(D/E)XK nuclease family protein n=1 Tax=Halobacterium salinarum TaxID=2242 RepID=UPI0025539ABC|nr:PD-(D/E)XK nuclease family protein [Halobacterium salinarum]MDL0145134.1 PD-(D/E)XK nuclease family protein [Halobacterium salinarum]
MPITRAKPVDTLYDEVRNYDLVIVPDAPLASGLNRRLDRPHLGSFAITPRRLAAGRRERAEDRSAFLELVTTTDLDWKQAAYAIGNTLQCWEHQGRVEDVVNYDAYTDAATETTVEQLSALDTTSRRLGEYQIDDTQDVAVVGHDQLTTLERSILPAHYDRIDPFAEAAFDRPPFHIFESSTAIVDAVLGVVTAENAEDVAVVADRGSEYSTLVESALEAAGIPFIGGPGFADDPHHRGFVQFLRAATRGTDTRVRTIRSVLSRLEIAVDVEHDDKRLQDVDAESLAWFRGFCAEIEHTTFAAALTEYERQSGASLDAFHDELEALGIANDDVTERAVDRLEFYLQSYEVPVDREHDGVLLADPKSAAYVDRPVVFYLGLDESWTHSPPRRPWVDRDAEFTRNLTQFQLLVQNGVEQYYLVQDTVGGSPATPCLYFEDLLEDEFDRFSDLNAVTHGRTFGATEDGFEKESLAVTPTEVDTVSQSSLSTYVNSPRDHLFSRLVDSPDKDYFKEGNLFHDFAEFYVNHPDQIDPETIEELVDVMLDETASFVRRVDRPTRRTKYQVGLETIVQLLDDRVPEGDDLLTPNSGWGQNFFADHFDRAVDSPFTERWFENQDLGMKGKIDLVHGPNHLFDYKSGSRKRASQVIKNSTLNPPSDTPNFQALLYLSHRRSERSDERLQFTFFHFLETLDDVVTGKANLDDTLTTIEYHPMPFVDHARSRPMFEELRNDGANNCQKTLSKIEYDDYRVVFERAPLPVTRDSDELIDSEFGQVMQTRLRECVGEYKYVTLGCKQLLRQLARVRSRNYFEEDLDAFEGFVTERIAELNRRRAGEERFPVNGLAGEPNYRRVDNRDLLINHD